MDNENSVCAEADGENTDPDSGSGSNSEERNQNDIADQIAAQTSTDIGTVTDALDILENHGIGPTAAKSSLVERYGADNPTIYGVSGIGLVRGHHLLEAGYNTPEAIAAASVGDLMEVSYLAEATAPAIRNEAQKYIKGESRDEN